MWESDYKDYWSSELWPVVSFFVAHLSAVVAPLIVYYRTRNSKQKLGRSLGSRCGSAFTIETCGFDADFERVLTHPVLFARFRTHCAQHFCSENIRMIENYQGLKFLTIQAFRGVAKGDGPSVSQVTLGTESGTETTTPAESLLSFSLTSQTLMLQVTDGINYAYNYLNVPSTALRRRGSATGGPLDSSPPLLLTSATPVPPLSNSVSHQTALAEPDFMTSPTVFIAPTIARLLRQLQSNNPKCNLDPENEIGRTVPSYLRPAYLSFHSTFTVRDAPLEVNLTSDTRERVRMLVDQDRFEVGMFDDAMREVLSNLVMDAFRTFTVRMELKHPAMREMANSIARGKQPLDTTFVADGESPIALQVRSWALN
ncbi:hypothetical protein BC937DRAFT_94664 [Endogone sp. FLAS-F59071]|nr:hypothetical protein BC937DRAFT_94664 [Endogone sp. FLAS-F59071]|eukprot:RUS20673.1 hypothetical protein BC937DRAFT_94664 [Endogone sp. FLAS-F59071]